MKYYSAFVGLLMILVISCNKLTENHYHDGVYHTDIWLADVVWTINGNTILIDNSLTGKSQIKCRQYPDRIEYTEPDGRTIVIDVLSNGDLKISDLITASKVQSEENEELSRNEEEEKGKREIHQVKKLKNQTQNIDLSKDSYQNEYAIIKDIFEANNEVYVVVDIVQIEYPQNEDEDDYSLSYEIINQNPKLRTYRAINNLKIAIIDHKCVDSTSSLKYLVNNKDRIQPVSVFGFVAISTNKQGELTELDFGCSWN